MRKLKIGILTHNYPLNSKDRKDAGIFIYDFAHELKKHAEVFVFCPDFGGKKENYKDVPVTWFKWGNSIEKFGNWKLFSLISLLNFFKLTFIGQRMAIDWAKNNNIDYCLSCWAIPSSIFAWQIRMRLNKPYSSWSLGSDVNKYIKIPLLSQLIYYSFKSTDYLFANSYALIDKVEKFSNKKCYFLPAITNFNTKSQKTKRKDKKFQFLFVGRLEHIKGPDVLVEAIKLTKNKRSNFTVNILGNGSLLNNLKQKISDYSLNNVKLLGWADERKVSSFMENSNCLIISSRSESLPLVLIEAAKKYLPIIATDVGDCKKILNKYKVGISIEKENPIALSKAMFQILKNNKYKKNKRGFQKLSNDFSQKKAVNTFLKKINEK